MGNWRTLGNSSEERATHKEYHSEIEGAQVTRGSWNNDIYRAPTDPSTYLRHPDTFTNSLQLVLLALFCKKGKLRPRKGDRSWPAANQAT